MHMDKWNTHFILVMLCSMRGTKIAGVEGLWLVSRPICSVSESADDSPEVLVCSPFIVLSQNSMRDHCDTISWCHNHLPWFSGGKTTAHAHRKHHSLSVHLPASTPESPLAIDASEPLHLFLNLNSLPVTYISTLHWYLYYNNSDVRSTYCTQYISYKGVIGCVHLSTSTPPTLKTRA